MTIQKTIVVVGGGYAGVNLIAALKKAFYHEKIILIDKNRFHFKKVKLFKAIVNEDVSDLHVPFSNYCSPDVEFIQGELTDVDHEEQIIYVTGEDGVRIRQNYDQLVLALGSVLCEVDSDRGGIALTSLEKANVIRQQLLTQLDSGKVRLAIVGGGITGVETAAELGTWLRSEGEKRGIQPEHIEVFLINKHDRLLNEAPVKISEKLENRIKKHGIQMIHHKTAEKFIDRQVLFSDHSHLEADVCIWTVGLKPHPGLRELGLSLTEEGKLKVDSWYRYVGGRNLYAIGDCVHVEDPISGSVAAMSCKEAISQAGRLAKMMKEGHTNTAHQTYPNLVCIGLGPTDGFIWAQKWGVDFVLLGKMAEKVREYTWNVASLNH